MTPWREAILLRSTAFRLAGAIALLFVSTTTVAFVAAYWLVSQDLDQRTRLRVLDDAQTLALIHDRGGADALRAQLKARARVARPDEALSAFFPTASAGQDGALPLDRPFTGWRTIAADEEPLADHYLAYGRALGDGTLIVARSTDAAEEVLEILASALLWGLGIASLLAVGGTTLMARRTEARIAAIGTALDAVAAGALERRVPADASAVDDLGRVSGSINGMLDRMSASIEGLRQVSADIAHDLRTPIQHLRSMLESLRREPDLTPSITSAVDRAIAQIDRIVQIFQALLRIAQIEGGRSRARFRPTDLTEVAQAVADAFLPAIEEAGHQFVVSIDPPDALLVRGDRDLLAQMLSNLLTNAIHHAGPSTTIGLSLGSDAEHAVLTVSDAGPGIPENEREHVFRRLYRLERSRTTEGSGLGLAMVAAVVALHDGEIRLEDNRPGVRAVIRLPLIG